MAGEAVQVGAALRDARLSLGATIDDVAEQLRINRRYLSALEEGRVRDLPGPAYAQGFVRSYAAALGLDADEMTRRFREGGGPGSLNRTDLVFPEPVPERGVPAGAVILVGAILAIGSYVVWWQWSGSGARSVDRVEPPPARIAEAARGTAPADTAPALPPTLGPAVPASPGTAGGAATRPPATPAVPAAPPTAPVPSAGNAPVQPGAPANRPATAAAPAGPSTPAAPAGTAAPGVPVAATAPAAPNAPGGAAPPASAPAAPAPPPLPSPATPAAHEASGRVVLRVTNEDSWVQVRDPRTRQTLLNRVLRPGESFTLPATEGLMLTTGKAQALEVVVDGQPTAALAGRVGVVRDVALDPARLRAAQAPGTAPAN
ncbi:helix-turn-helix domain-containing protein [Roseomonas sp. BN140053]|uniref:helix-turn-helix domain-containing protein n=1 Tax=Roseomonas sp. BN140053 TaxID=3391898 RepID=UPI0039EB461D